MKRICECGETYSLVSTQFILVAIFLKRTNGEIALFQDTSILNELNCIETSIIIASHNQIFFTCFEKKRLYRYMTEYKSKPFVKMDLFALLSRCAHKLLYVTCILHCIVLFVNGRKFKVINTSSINHTQFHNCTQYGRINHNIDKCSICFITIITVLFITTQMLRVLVAVTMEKDGECC